MSEDYKTMNPAYHYCEKSDKIIHHKYLDPTFPHINKSISLKIVSISAKRWVRISPVCCFHVPVQYVHQPNVKPIDVVLVTVPDYDTQNTSSSLEHSMKKYNPQKDLLLISCNATKRQLKLDEPKAGDNNIPPPFQII